MIWELLRRLLSPEGDGGGGADPKPTTNSTPIPAPDLNSIAKEIQGKIEAEYSKKFDDMKKEYEAKFAELEKKQKPKEKDTKDESNPDLKAHEEKLQEFAKRNAELEAQLDAQMIDNQILAAISGRCSVGEEDTLFKLKRTFTFKRDGNNIVILDATGKIAVFDGAKKMETVKDIADYFFKQHPEYEKANVNVQKTKVVTGQGGTVNNDVVWKTASNDLLEQKK